MPGTLRVLTTSAFVPNYENLRANPPAVVGRRWIAVDGKMALEETEGPSELPVRAEYVLALRVGHLLPADQFTADQAGVAFSPPKSGAVAPSEE